MSHADDLKDSGLKPDDRGMPITVGECRAAVRKMHGADEYYKLLIQFLLRRVERLERTVKCSTAQPATKSQS